ncbi:MAG: hypothetical protein WC750_03450 [Patescibacteria group bacterium]|jgi:hypothetical protein
MSWSQVFKTARRLGAPVIVTDQAGQDPLIILPLETYDGLVGQGSPAQRQPRTRGAEPDESIFEFQSEEVSSTDNSKNLAKESQKVQNEVEIDGQESEVDGSQEISLDERFYFEPLEDEVKK